MKSLLAYSVTLCCLAVPVSAQTPPAPVPTTQPAAQGELRKRMRFEVLARRLAIELKLDDAQRTQFDEILARHQSEATQAAADDETRMLASELKSARESGDRERAAELAREIRERREGRGDIEKLVADVEPLLRADQMAGLERFRELTRGDRLYGGAGGSRLEHTVRRLEEDLRLTDEQLPEFDTLVETYRERYAEQADARSAVDEEQARLLRELRDARDANQAAKVHELEQMLADRRDEDLQLLNQFLAELEPLLRDDQRAVVEQYRDRNALVGGDADDPRSVLRAARRLRLDDDGRERLREIERETMMGLRKLDNRDKDAAAALATRAKESISALLTEEQRAEFDKLLKRGTRAGRAVGPRPVAPPAEPAPAPGAP